MLQVGSVLDGKYKILSEIGHGGMSTVYLAINERANKTWAVKEVRKTGINNYEVIRQGLLAETNILKRLNHPNLPSIIDVIDSEDTFVIVMDFIEGTDLQKRLRSGAQPWEDVVDWGIQLCDVLDYLHCQNPPIIYRDMKPANIILKPEGLRGKVMLLDFGTAREYKGDGSSADTTCLGTRGYAAPEQYGGQGETDARTDIYTLGATLYHLLTGLRPDAPPHYKMILLRQANPALPLEEAESLQIVIDKCTQTNKDLRYQNCRELKYDLQHLPKPGSIRQMKTKMGLFVASAILTVVFGLACFGSSFGVNYYSTAQYGNLLQQGDNYASSSPAENTADYNQAKDYYLQGIELQPTTVDCYTQLLRLYRMDGRISFAEYNSIFNVYSGLQSSREDYQKFCFDFGEFLFFNFASDDGTLNETQGRDLSARFLEVAKDSELLSDEGKNNGAAKKRLAEALYSIANRESELNPNPLMAGDYTYEDYWSDLTAMDCTTLISDIDGTNGSAYLVLSIYRTILAEINANYANFSSAGVSASTMEGTIQDIETGLALLDREFPSLDSTSQTLRDEMSTYITSARRMLHVVA